MRRGADEQGLFDSIHDKGKGRGQRLCGRPFGTACKIPPVYFYSIFSRRDRLSIDNVVQCFREHETTKESRQSIEKDDNYVKVPLCSPC